MAYHLIVDKSNTTGATSGTRTGLNKYKFEDTKIPKGSNLMAQDEEGPTTQRSIERGKIKSCSTKYYTESYKLGNRNPTKTQFPVICDC
jgi:hypothetical protein